MFYEKKYTVQDLADTFSLKKNTIKMIVKIESVVKVPDFFTSIENA